MRVKWTAIRPPYDAFGRAVDPGHPPIGPQRAPDRVDQFERPGRVRVRGVERFLVTGGARLAGTVEVAGAKNSVLKLMAAALLAEGTTVISNCPEILDVPLMAD